MDHLTAKDRSSLMAKVRGKNTKPEIFVRKLIWSMGFRYRLHVKTLPGTPDIVFRPKKKVIFINGCFWHGHSCRRKPIPSTRSEFWREKIERNQKRDLANVDKLEKSGWAILVIWECELKKPDFTWRIR